MRRHAPPCAGNGMRVMRVGSMVGLVGKDGVAPAWALRAHRQPGCISPLCEATASGSPAAAAAAAAAGLVDAAARAAPFFLGAIGRIGVMH